jgi:hypothetical protein
MVRSGIECTHRSRSLSMKKLGKEGVEMVWLGVEKLRRSMDASQMRGVGVILFREVVGSNMTAGEELVQSFDGRDNYRSYV